MHFSGLSDPLKIPLHSNVQWKTAHAILNRANKLCQVRLLSELLLQSSVYCFPDIQQYFSSKKQPTLWQALPALKALQSAWEVKTNKR
jgi:hypothetical protein